MLRRVNQLVNGPLLPANESGACIARGIFYFADTWRVSRQSCLLSGWRRTGQGAATSIVHLNSNLSSDADIYGKQQKNNEAVEHRKEGMIGIYF